MFLATTARKEWWPAGSEILILGPWCVRSEDPDWLKGWRVRMLPNIWDDRARLERAAAYCGEVQPRLLEGLAGYLDSVHGTRLSVRYWKALLGLWLLYYTHQLFDRYSQIRAALDREPGLSSVCLRKEDFRTPRDAADYLAFFHSERYDLQLYSTVFRHLGLSFPEVSLEYENVASAAGRAGGGLLARGRRATRAAVLRCATSLSLAGIRRAAPDVVTDDLYPMPLPALLKLCWRTRGRLLPMLRRLPESARVQAAPGPARSGLAGIHGEDDFQRLLIGSLPWAFPAIWLEGFAAARASTPALRGPVPRAIFSSTGLFYNDAFKFAAAEWAQRGAELWGLQHGGQYGTAKYSLAEDFERGLCDRYFTWGWASTADDPRLRDLPAPALSEAASGVCGTRGKGAERRDILLCSLENVKNAHHLFPHPMGWQWEESFKALERFIAAMGPAAPLRLRPYPHDYGWGLRKRLRAAFPGLRFDDPGVPFLRSARGCRLVATDYPGTPFYELLALDIPSVHFWDPRLWELRPEAEGCFAQLRESGIVHETPDSAARHIERLGAGLEEWWASSPVREARARFAGCYAKTDARWVDAWRSTLAGEIRRT